jgi:transcriptional regulator with XRE-family HTH domain
MSRPAKRVSPDTLGGRIRAARQQLRLSLADVAAERYSTSLLSQIERNRVDPSAASLQYLAERLQLPVEDLLALAQQHRESEVETAEYKIYGELRRQAQHLLVSNRPREALAALEEVDLVQIPVHERWRLAALRGECYFTAREFRRAQHNFLYAVAQKPVVLPSEQAQEGMLLSLHLGAASRELGQLEEAASHYETALSLMDAGTSLRYIAEAHWGMALVLFEQARQFSDERGSVYVQGPEAEAALSHAESARTLYQSIGDELHAAALSCEVGLIEQAVGNLGGARKALHGVLDTWQPEQDWGVENTAAGRRRTQERANVVSAAACYLAGVELEAGTFEGALASIREAQKAGKESHAERRAEALMMLGKILEAQSAGHPECDGAAAEEAFEQAISELGQTERGAAKMKALDLLGRHLLKKGKVPHGEKVLDRARRLSQYVPTERAFSPESDG